MISALITGMAKTGINGLGLISVPLMALAFNAFAEKQLYWHRCLVLSNNQPLQNPFPYIHLENYKLADISV